LVLERNALKNHADSLMQANLEIEKELDNFVNLDESIVKTLEKRDDRLSPLRPPSNFQPVRNVLGTYNLGQSRMFDLHSAEQARLSPFQQQAQMPVFNTDKGLYSAREERRVSDQNAYRDSHALRFLNPRSLSGIE